MREFRMKVPLPGGPSVTGIVVSHPPTHPPTHLLPIHPPTLPPTYLNRIAWTKTWAVTGLWSITKQVRPFRLLVYSTHTPTHPPTHPLGKAPALKYSDAVNQRIINDKFFQLKIYAILLGEVKKRIPTKLKVNPTTHPPTHL